MRNCRILNCPAYSEKYDICGSINKEAPYITCEYTEACILKKIVEECEKACKIYDREEHYDDDADKFMGEAIFAERILSLIKVKK